MTHPRQYPSDRAIRAALIAACCAACALAFACRGAPEQIREGATGPVTLPPDSLLAAVAIGDIAGGSPNVLAETIKNPYEGDRAAAEAGQQLFTQMNCVGCHGYDAKGGMGPNLTDTYWRYGGSPAEIYKSIYEGRPQGMPAWGHMLTHEQVWKLVTYIEALGGTFPAQLAEAGREGNLGNKDTAAAATMKGRQDEQ